MIKSRVSVFIASADRHRSLMTRANMADQCIKACKMFESLQKSSIENYIKSLIQKCGRSELRLHFGWTKVHFKSAKNGPFLGDFGKLKLAVKQCYQKGQL